MSVLLVTRHAKRILPVFICGLSGSTIFFHIVLKKKSTIFGKKVTEGKNVFRFSLQLLSETFLILRKNQRGIIHLNIVIRVKYPKTERVAFVATNSLVNVGNYFVILA